MHNAAFAASRIDAVYVALPVRAEELPDAVRGLAAAHALGANVTMPHKEAVVPLLDELAPEAAAIGAVNTIELREGRTIGHNTDPKGLVEFILRDVGTDATGARALVLGAGGAARAVLRALERLGVSETVVVGRDVERARGVANLARTPSARPAPWDESDALASQADIVVNATPLGARGEEILERTRFHGGQIVIDLITDPPETALVARARVAGASAWGGLGMLVRQGAESFRIWTRAEAPYDIMLRAAQLEAFTNHGRMTRAGIS